jgi:hypothetical protein
MNWLAHGGNTTKKKPETLATWKSWQFVNKKINFLLPFSRMKMLKKKLFLENKFEQ